MAALLSQVEEVSSEDHIHSDRRVHVHGHDRGQVHESLDLPTCVGTYWAFKERAKKCTSPCDWTPGNHSGSL
jgi:hypothetical protein